MGEVSSENVPALAATMVTPNVETSRAVPDAVLLVALVGAALCFLSAAVTLAAVAVLVLTWQPPAVEVAEHTCSTTPPPWVHYVELERVEQVHWFRRIEDYQFLVDGGYIPRAVPGVTHAQTASP